MAGPISAPIIINEGEQDTLKCCKYNECEYFCPIMPCKGEEIEVWADLIVSGF
jgi:hypothetical protein